MGFRYTPYEPQYPNTIGALLLRQGDIAARQAEINGAAQARAAEQRGAILGGTTRNIGQILSGSLDEVQRRRDQAPIRELQQLQLHGAQQTARDDQRLRDAYTQTGGDPAQMRALLAKSGGLTLQHDQTLQQMEQQKQARDADLTTSIGLRLHARIRPDDPTAALTAMQEAIDTAERYHLIMPDQAQEMGAAVSADPSRIADVATGWIAASPRGQTLLEKLTTVKSGDKVFGFDRLPVPGMEAPEKKPDYTIGNQRFSGTTSEPIGAPVPVAVPPAPAQSHNMRLTINGKTQDVPVDYVPKKDGSGGTWMYQGKDVTGQVSAIPPASIQINTANRAGAPGDFSKTGEEFLPSIPRQWQPTVKKIANYEEDPTKVASMRSGMRETLMQWVNQVNPAYDQSQFAIRNPVRKAYTIGTQGQQINAINTAIGHIDQLTVLADELGNAGFTPANKAFNAIKTMFGGATVTNFDTLKDALAGEVSSVLAKGGATVSGIAEAKDKIHASNSPQQLAGYVKTLIPIMGSKLAALDDQYKQAMGADSFSALSKESQRILAKHGFDPAHPTIGQPVSAPADGTEGAVNGVPAVWKTVNGKAGWYRR